MILGQVTEEMVAYSQMLENKQQKRNKSSPSSRKAADKEKNEKRHADPRLEDKEVVFGIFLQYHLCPERVMLLGFENPNSCQGM